MYKNVCGKLKQRVTAMQFAAELLCGGLESFKEVKFVFADTFFKNDPECIKNIIREEVLLFIWSFYNIGFAMDAKRLYPEKLIDKVVFCFGLQILNCDNPQQFGFSEYTGRQLTELLQLRILAYISAWNEFVAKIKEQRTGFDDIALLLLSTVGILRNAADQKNHLPVRKQINIFYQKYLEADKIIEQQAFLEFWSMPYCKKYSPGIMGMVADITQKTTALLDAFEIAN